MLGSFTCLAPVHDNASTVRCANHPEVIRLMGYDAPAMPATCLPSEICPPGDPFAARDALRGRRNRQPGPHSRSLPGRIHRSFLHHAGDESCRAQQDGWRLQLHAGSPPPSLAAIGPL
jgi:hypothetical protein